MNLFKIENNYISFLKHKDKRVPDNYGEKKPFVGVLIKIKDMIYVAPLSSGKAKHSKIKNSSPLVFKIKDGSEIIAIIQLNNMIQVNEKNITKINIDQIKNKQYKTLMQKEINYIRVNKEIIFKKANQTYKKRAVLNDINFKKICCDFKKLEIECLKYNT